MKKRAEKLKLIDLAQLNHDNFLLTLQSSSSLDDIIPGQFVNILVENSPQTFLRRPFSIHDIDLENRSLKVIIKVVGCGSKKLSGLIVGNKVDTIFPLGNGFTLPSENERILLVGGGCGVAPMLFMARKSIEQGAIVDVLLGARSANDHILIAEFSAFANVHIASDDGSLGQKGFVTQHDIMNGSTQFDKIYCCGPELMMKAVALRAKQQNTYCEVSLENTMACGFGVCLCCVTETKSGNTCVCTEGPVFNINDLKWEI